MVVEVLHSKVAKVDGIQVAKVNGIQVNQQLRNDMLQSFGLLSPPEPIDLLIVVRGLQLDSIVYCDWTQLDCASLRMISQASDLYLQPSSGWPSGDIINRAWSEQA